MNLRENRPTLPPNVATILGEDAKTEPEVPAAAAAPAANEARTPPAAPASAAPAGATAAEPAGGAPAPFDPFTSEIDDPIFKAEEVAGPGLTREQILALPDEVKRSYAHMRKDYTKKTQALAAEKAELAAARETKKAAEAAPAPAPRTPEMATLEAALGSEHEPLKVLLGKSEEWKHLPLPEKLAIDDLPDEDLYDPAKLRSAMRTSIDQATQARLRDGFKAFLAPWEQHQAKQADETRKEASRAAAQKWITEHPGMDVRENRQAVYKLADTMGGGAEGLDAAFRVWRSENPDKAKAAPAPAAAAPAASAVVPPVAAAPAPAVAPVVDEAARLRAENEVLKTKLRQAPIEQARELAAANVGKGGSGPTGHLAKLPANLSPMERAAWLRDHPEVSNDIRTGGLRRMADLRNAGRM